MKTIALVGVAFGLVAAATHDTEQEAPKASEPQRAREWLAQLVGEWAYESEGIVDPNQPPVKSQGTERARAFGENWVVAESTGQTPTGAPMSAILTLGYDPAKKKFVGTWVCSMMCHLWTYEGTLDATGKVLTLETEGPNPAVPGKSVKYRDVIEIKGADQRVHTSSMQADDGKWFSFVTVDYRRRKP